jgi:hypothetical protein
MRKQIVTEKREAEALQAENEAMRAQMQLAMTQTSLSLTWDQRGSLLNVAPEQPLLGNEAGVGDVDIALDFDEVMNTSCYYSSNLPLPSHEHSPAPESTIPLCPSFPELTPAQTQQAIQFTLA